MNKSKDDTKDLSVYPVKIDETNMDIVDKYPLLPIPFMLRIQPLAPQCFHLLRQVF